MSHTFTLDGKVIPFAEGQTILQAVERASKVVVTTKKMISTRITSINGTRLISGSSSLRKSRMRMSEPAQVPATGGVIPRAPGAAGAEARGASRVSSSWIASCSISTM